MKETDNSQIGKASYATQFLSNRFENLYERLKTEHRNVPHESTDFDVIIVGSGYGGAICAHELSKSINPETKQPLRVCVLERGAERLPGSFPSTIGMAPKDIRIHTHGSDRINGNTSGLFDIRVGSGYSALVANGLGGGSLINAGVILKPEDHVFRSEQWPKGFAADTRLKELFEEAADLLGARVTTPSKQVVDNTVELLDEEYPKFKALRELGKNIPDTKFVAVPLSIKLDDQHENQAIKTDQCIGCGDCFSGCNHNAKKSLDTNLLASAQSNGVDIFCGATVNYFQPEPSGGWSISVMHTDAVMNRRLGPPIKIRTKKLILSCGSLGSTELLLKSQSKSDQLSFSKQLGERFSGNGDMVANLSDWPTPTNSIASEKIAPASRHVGPTIIGMLDRRKSAQKSAIQDLTIPAVLRHVVVQAVSFSRTLDALGSFKDSIKNNSEPFVTLLANKLEKQPTSEADNLMVVAMMGMDDKYGSLTLPDHKKDDHGVLDLQYPSSDKEQHENQAELKCGQDQLNFYESNMAFLRYMVSKNIKNALVHANPLWKPLGSNLTELFNLFTDASDTPDASKKDMTLVRGEISSNDKPADNAFDSAEGFDFQSMLITVHPLGGCCMADSIEAGVVNEFGEVFDANSAGNTYEDLIVLDGSILPSAVGINPALTISTVSLRAVRHLIARCGWGGDDSTATPLHKAIERPKAKYVDVNRAVTKTTKAEVVERLVGEVTLGSGEDAIFCMAVLTLRTEPFDIAHNLRFRQNNLPLRKMAKGAASGRLPNISTLHLFRMQDWKQHHDINEILKDRSANKATWFKSRRAFLEDYESALDMHAFFKAPLDGSINLLEETPIYYLKRFFHGFLSWYQNRGKRDNEQSNRGKPKRSVWIKVKGYINYVKGPVIATFAHAGRQRRLDYHLKIGQMIALPSKSKINSEVYEALNSKLNLNGLSGQCIEGHKLFAYARRSNPWRQLMDISVTKFPMMNTENKAVLSVAPEYFAKTKVPLLHIVDEDNAVDGYADALAFYAHMMRVLVLQYFWIFRKPDTPQGKENKEATGDPILTPEQRRFPPEQLNDFERSWTSLYKESEKIVHLVFDNKRKNVPDIDSIQAGLTRYRKVNVASVAPPVLCIHGYSASGTTFAHESLYGGKCSSGGLASYLCNENRDVWILDLRSSCAFESGQENWEFEDMAYFDIPRALNEICLQTGSHKVDVVAHCMGSVMLSMMIMGDPSPSQCDPTYSSARGRIRKIVLSQAGPFMQFTRDNLFRSYLIKYFRELLPNETYTFNPKSEGLNWFDRVLSSLPYPDNSEYDFENPVKGDRFWVKTRHRMDALYGRTFSVKNMHEDVLSRIDDFFASVNFHTLEQTLWLSQRGQVSGRYNSDFTLNTKKISDNWPYKTLWIHGNENGLVDPESAARTALFFDEHGNDNLEINIIPNVGHQDSLMGNDCEIAFKAITNHLL